MSKPVEPIYSLFGNRVFQIREVLGLTQEELSGKVGLDRTSIASIEAGRQRVLLHDLEKFAKAFGMSPVKFMKGIWL